MEETSGSEENIESINNSINIIEEEDGKRLQKKNSESSCKSKRSVRRKLKTFSFGKWQKGINKEKTKKRSLNLNREICRSSSSVISESSVESVTCMCTGYRKTRNSGVKQNLSLEEIQHEKDVAVESNPPSPSVAEPSYSSLTQYREATDRIYEEPIQVGRYETDSGVQLRDVPSGSSSSNQQPLPVNEINIAHLRMALRDHLRLTTVPSPLLLGWYSEISMPFHVADARHEYETSLAMAAHTQVDYIHHLVPDLVEITNCGYYWGKMDRYKAEKQLDKKPEGTFLLRDSAQEEFLFSVSFRRYGRTLHARIEQQNHMFSFDSHDPNVFASLSVCSLVEHYKNPRCCMFFEPMLTLPVHRTFPFDLQHLCRAVISDNITYDRISLLKLPKKLKSYLKEYHYKQKVRVRHLEKDV